jgi:hypothetical protein
MKKSLFVEQTYKKVSEKDIAPIATALDPLNSTRVPEGTYTVKPNLHFIPASGEMIKPWQAVILENADEVFPVSPRVFLGLGYVESRLVEVMPRNFGKKTLISLIADGKFMVTVSGYESVNVDNFTTKKLEPKDFPVIVAGTATITPKVTKTRKNKNQE